MDITDNGQIISNSFGSGKAGNIKIEARQISLTDGAQIGSGTFGPGQGGAIIIKAEDTLTASEGGMGIFTNSQSREVDAGDAGNIDIQAREISLTDGAQIASGTFGHGQGGTILVRTNDALTASGGGTGIFGNSESRESDAGNAGNIDIQARQISLTNGAQIGNGTFGPGQGGPIVVKADDILTASGGGSGIFGNSGSREADAGNAGNIEIQTREISLADGAQIASATFGSGEGGSIIIRADNLLTASGSYIYTDSYGEESDAGNGGNIEMRARQITLTNGAQIASGTLGSGQGGTIIIRADDLLTVSGTDEAGYSSGAFANSRGQEANAGKSGDIEIEARQIALTRKARISNAIFGPGQGGLIVIRADDLLTASGTDEAGYVSGIFANSRGREADAGKGGSIEIQAGQITLTGGSQIASGTFGPGQGGLIIIRADDLLTASGTDEAGYASGIFASSESESDDSGKAGTILLSAQKVILSDKGINHKK